MTPPPVARVRECQACHHVSGLGEAACPACLRDDSFRERFQCSRCERLLDGPTCPVCSVRRPEPPPEPAPPAPRPRPRRTPARRERPRPVPVEEPVFPYEAGEPAPPFRRSVWPPVRRRPVHLPPGGPIVGVGSAVPVALVAGLLSVPLSCASPLGPLLGLVAFFAALKAYAGVFTGRSSRAALPLVHFGMLCALCSLGMGLLMLLASLTSAVYINGPHSR